MEFFDNLKNKFKILFQSQIGSSIIKFHKKFNKHNLYLIFSQISFSQLVIIYYFI